MAGAGRVVGPDLVLQEASGFQVAGLHGGIGLVVDVTPAEVSLSKAGALNGRDAAAASSSAGERLVRVDDVVRGILGPLDGSP